MTHITLRTPSGYAEERKYIADVVVREFLGLEFELVQTDDLDHVELTVADGSAKRVVLPDTLFATPRQEWLSAPSLPGRPLHRADLGGTPLEALAAERELPLLYAERNGAERFLADSPSEVRLSVDIFGSAFFMLTRYEEVVKTDRDERDRFPVTASLAMQEGFLHRALINEYLELLWWALRRLWPRLDRKERSFNEVLSHDVDHPYCVHGRTIRSVMRTAAGDTSKRRDPLLGLDRAYSLMRTRTRGVDGDVCFKVFEFLMGCSERHGLTSTFNFMSDRTAPEFDVDYDITDPQIRNLLRRIRDRGHTIGVHPSYETYRNPRQVKVEYEKLRQVCSGEGIVQDVWGGRQHFLRWENPTTWQGWEDAGLTLDSSLGLSSGAGFRCGVCYDYPVFNLLTRKALALRERPLIVMDSGIVSGTYQDPNQIRDAIISLKVTCRRFRGEFTMLWHNDWLASRRLKRVYEEILEA
jgi:hypothetical protein